MSPPHDSRYNALTEAQMVLVNRLCNQFEARWQRGEKITVEDVLGDVTRPDRFAALNELLPLEVEYRCRAGQELSLDDYTARFPDLDKSWLGELLDTTRIIDRPTLINDPLDTSEVPQKLGDYRIISRIGGGGMGTVYKAIHERMGRTVALKVLRTEIQRDLNLLKRFDREVRAAARLTHPNIVAALDAREQDGVHYLITEYVDGIDLQVEVIRNGPMRVATAVDCILQAARGLDYAHRQGVIHRDIKPANLLRDAHGVVKVLDMGLARLDTPDDPSATNLTQSGMVMGTAAYMSPEQARDTRRADARSDVYSLGCTLFYLLNGRSIFVGESIIDTIISHVSHPVPMLARVDSKIPVSLERIFHRMVAKDPGDRFQTAAELVAALETIRAELPIEDPADHDATQVHSTSHAASLDRTETTGNGLVMSSPTQMARSPQPASVKERSNRRMILGGAISMVLAVMILYFTFPFLFPKGDSSPPPSLGGGIRFDGETSFVEVPGLLPEAGETYTLEVIAQPLGYRTSNMISWLGPDWMALFILQSGHFGVCRRVGDQSYLIQTRDPAVLGETVHLAGIYRGKDLRLYVNGQLAPSYSFQYELGDATGGLYIGGVRNNVLPHDQETRFFQGTIRAVRISRGIRYPGPFQRPTHLAADQETIVVFPFEEGRGAETRSKGDRPWVGRIINAQWQPSPVPAR